MTRLRFSVFGAALVFVLACSDSTSPGRGGPAFYSFQVNGESWNLAAVRSYESVGAVGVLGYHSIPKSTNRAVVVFRLDPFTGTGAYPLDSGGHWLALYVYDSAGAVLHLYESPDGTPDVLRITRYGTGDSSITGNYHAELTDHVASGAPLVVDGNFLVRPIP